MMIAIGRVVILGLFFIGISSNSFAGNLSSESKISQVTVYPGSARVTRQVQVDLSVGAHSIILENIIPRLDENSLTVTGQGVADVKIFGVAIKRVYSEETADQRVKDLEAIIEKLSDDIIVENQNLQTLQKEIQFLDSIKLFSGQQVPKDLVTTMPSVESLEGVRKFLMDGFKDVEKKKEVIRIKIRELQREQVVAQRQLNELRSFGSQQQHQLVVDLECVRSGKFTLNVSYLVFGANWKAIYDARANYDGGEVELTLFGKIKQTTGEDWDEVELTLSTAQPTVSGRLPHVAPWILHPYQSQSRERVARKMKGLADSAQYEPYYLKSDYKVSRDEIANAPALMEANASFAFSEVAQKGISIVYKITRPATIKSDGTEIKYPITSQVLNAKFEYSSYPRLKPFAYLGSRVTNSQDIQLLAGQVNLFLDGDYIGKSSIDNVGPGEEFNLYLGIDENVKVKREQISRKVDDILIGNIKSPNRKTTITNKLTVENFKNKKITVHLFEAIPVSQDERIKVRTFDVSRKPTDVDWEDRKGVWRWEFPLKSKGKQEITYSFSVDHPRDINIPGI